MAKILTEFSKISPFKSLAPQVLALTICLNQIHLRQVLASKAYA